MAATLASIDRSERNYVTVCMLSTVVFLPEPSVWPAVPWLPSTLPLLRPCMGKTHSTPGLQATRISLLCGPSVHSTIDTSTLGGFGPLAAATVYKHNLYARPSLGVVSV